MLGINDTIYDIVTEMANRGYSEVVVEIDPDQFECIRNRDPMINRIDVRIKFSKVDQNDS